MTISNSTLNVFNQYPSFDINKEVPEVLTAKTFRKSATTKNKKRGDVTDLFGVKAMIYTFPNGSVEYIYCKSTGQFLPKKDRLRIVNEKRTQILKEMGLTISLSRRITNFLGTTVNVS